MNQKLQNILDIIQQSEKLDAEQKDKLLKAVKDADKELEITSFKLDRTEKVKKTTAILLEETIEELEQKRKAVEAQNRELEIEAALERVRTVAMSMNKSEDLLSICEIFFKEFKNLGFNNLRNSLINIFNDEKESFVNYDYSDYMGGSISNVSYNSNPANDEFLIQIRKANDAFVETVIDRNQLDEWKEFRRSHGEQDDSRLDNINALYYYNYSIGSGSIGISNFNPISEEQQIILKRFRNVFNLSYKRYIDISLAEAQAREAQIEAALERVRARAMGMRKSEEAGAVSDILFAELNKLGFDISGCSIVVIDEREDKMEVWRARSNVAVKPFESASLAEVMNILKKHLPDFFPKFLNAVGKRKGYLIDELSGERRLQFINAVTEQYNYSKTEKSRLIKNTPEKFAAHYVLFKLGYLALLSAKKLSDEDLSIARRFIEVFDFAYTRFLDIKKAEAQARESQIELALERVRARTMAMQKSDELKEVIKLVYEQFFNLKINVDHAGFVVNYTPKGDWHFWIADQQEIPSKITHPYFDSVWAHQFNEAKEKGIDYFTTNLNFEEKNIFYNELLSYVPGLPEKSKEFYLRCPGLAATTVLFDNVSLYIENFSGTPYTDEENKILIRFGKVFQQTYTRFLDLQKAEAQARESQIELALERVRARTMAMHNSQDVGDTVVTLFDEVLKLGLDKSIRCGIGILEGSEHMETWSATSHPNGEVDLKMGMLDMTIHPMLIGLKKAWKNGEPGYSYDYIGDDVFRYYSALNKEPDYPFQKDLGSLPENEYHKSFFFTEGILFAFAPSPISEEASRVLDRFARVFGQTYRRYLDLQKAEAQAREAQIELALERVRASAMAMHNSIDVGNATAIMFTELEKLGIETLRCGIEIMNKNKIMEVWATSSSDKGEIQIVGKLDTRIHPHLQSVQESWERQDKFISLSLEGQELKDYYKIISTAPDYRVPAPNIQSNKQFNYDFFFKEGGLFVYREKPFTEEEVMIFQRFTAVFGLTFRRYLDLKKAEEQAREAQIEASLEKVRAVAMSMNKSDDLLSICEVSFKEFKKLGFDNIRNALIHVQYDEQKYFMDYDFSDLTGGAITKIEYGSHPVVEDYLQQINSAEDAFYQGVIKEDQLEEWKNFRKNSGQIDDPRLEKATALHYYFFSIGIGDIGISTLQPINESQIKILKRFRNVFDLAYRRYNDIALAEEQARETQIQLALERVRARTMAMHKSEELSETSFVLFEQLKELGEVADQMSITIYDEEEGIVKLYSTIYGNKWEETGRLPFDKNSVLRKIHRAWKEKKKSIVLDLSGKELEDFNKFKMEYSTQYKSEEELPKERWVMHYVFFSNGAITFSSHEPRPPETIQLLERFASVFDLTYTRFLDLQKAEAQAREAQIEAALERVRSRTMAMQKSDELAEAAAVLFDQMVSLGIVPKRCVISIINNPTKSANFWVTSSEGKVIPGTDLVPLTEEKNLIQVYRAWKKKEAHYSFKVSGEDRLTWTNYIMNKVKMHLPEYQPDTINREQLLKEPAIFNCFFIAQGFVMLHTVEDLSDEDITMLKRFASVFEQTYTRFLDLKRAEAQAREAIKQAALDRIRGEIASMRTSEDLNHITPIIWRELKNLEVPFFRCGVYIVDEISEMVKVYLTTPDGKSLGVLNLSFDSSEITTETVEHWRKKIVYKTHWDREEFIEWTEAMMKLGQIQSAEIYQGSTSPPDSLYLHFVPFAQGMLYVGDVQPLTDEKLQLVKTIAEAFSIAYARYEDFNNLEEAKNKIEITLNDLKAAQAQLIHSEKMASLGELTAGIAHEIKNPLNFVNNFSEVSRELLDEMQIEIKNNNIEDVIDLVEDLKQNLDKINQHGKRADSIVKGMLLHSRGTSGEKTPTDINDLLDQYVNLAFHGMRATNKEFNITIEKDYDKSIEKINVVPQDLSRVFLNIINNACYAAFDKKKKGENNFSPTLSVSTKRLNNKVEIKIGDNGNGIPADHLDKIFQPFFTTKPSGEGTGLGLSLSYDIVTKVHGGDLKVKTKDGEGTEFLILLPSH